jgi:hypothetical protein
MLVLLLACADDPTCTPAIPVGAEDAVLVVRPQVPFAVLATGRVFVGAIVEEYGVFGADADPEAGCAVLVLPPGTYTTWVYAENAEETRCGWAEHTAVELVAGEVVERDPVVVMDACSTDTAAR